MSHQFVTANYRKLLLVVVVSCLTFSQLAAQQIIGRQKVDQYQTTPWGTTTYGLTWLPTDYNTNTTQKYPLIIFLHGSGEGGDGVGGLWTLASQGLPYMIANGVNPEAVNPADGQNYKFIVVSPQAPWSMHWSYGYAVIQYILADVMDRYRVDPSRVYVTGLSAGGSGTYSCVTNGPAFAKKFAAIVPVCPAGTNTQSEFDQLPLVGGTYGVPVWSPVGAVDALFTWAQNTVNTINSANPAPSEPAILTPIPGVGHEPAAWNKPYDPNWRPNGLNTFEWMLKHKRGPGGGPGGNGGPGNQPPTANAGADQTITLPQSSVQLNGSGSDPDGALSNLSWIQVSGPSTAQFSNANSASTTVSNLVAGTYTFRLTVIGHGPANGPNAAANTATDDVTVTVRPAPSYTAIPAQIEAENYSNMSGIQTENTADAGGGQNVGWQENNDWMDYNISVPSAGNYTVNFRVATPNSGVQFQLRNASGAALTTVNVPNTGNYQVWQTVSASISLPAGQQTVRIYTTNANGGWNINWMQFAVPTPTITYVPVPARIEAESFVAMSGIQTEATSDAGGGQNVGWQDNNDWMDYAVNVASAGSYTVNFRVATQFNNAQFQLRRADGSVLTTVTVPNTGGFQSWQNVSAQVTLPAGQQLLRIYTSNANGGWNLNWMEFAQPAPSQPQGNLHIEAENYSAMSGVQTENTNDAGGGRNVGWQDNNDWMDYSVNLSAQGVYALNFRVASMFTGARFQVRNASGNVLATVTVPNTGGFQAWQTVSVLAALPAGQQTLRIVTTAANGGWNINWFEINSDNSLASQKIEAESYTAMSGIQTEATLDNGGGWNVGWQDNNDNMDYVVTTTGGNYTANFRVASMFSGAQFQLRLADGTVLATVTVPNTGNFQTWQTVSAPVNLPAGQQTLRIVTTNANGGWNINWFELAGTASVARTASVEAETAAVETDGMGIFPNPVQDRVSVRLTNQMTGKVQVQVYNMSGVLQKQYSLNKTIKGSTQLYLSIGDLPQGQYLMKATMADWTQTSKIIKL